MTILKKIVVAVWVLSLFTSVAFAETFVVRAIHVKGLQRVSRQTVLDYLPVKVGQTFDTTETAEIIRSLYQTGFFSNVEVNQENNNLIIHVSERPIIGSIKVSGNHDIDKDKLDVVLKNIGLVEGRALDNAVLDRLRKSLQSEYYNRAKYKATVTTTITPQERGRVAVKIDVSEGRPAEVKKITIMGNHAFSTSTLLNQISLSSTNLLSFFTSSDRYTQQALSKTLDELRTFYLNHGYIRFNVESSSANITPDKTAVYITIHINEGARYTIKGYRLSGSFVVPEQEIQPLILIRSGDSFSQRAVRASVRSVRRLLGNKGYLFAGVNAIPEINDNTHEVFLTFVIEPNQRVYVRRISFSGNTRTADTVLRHKLQQVEGGVASTRQIRESTRRLRLLGYLQNIKVKTIPVAEHPDQVDLDYSVTEVPSAGASFGLGYGTNGLYLNATINQTNFLGTGKYIGATFQRTNFDKNYTMSYNDPNYTINGIERGFSIYATQYTPALLNVTNYTFNSYGANVNYNIPINAKNDYLQVALGYQGTQLQIGRAPSRELVNFVTDNGRCGTSYCMTHFNQALLTLGWARNYLDRAIFPTQGINQMASLQVASTVGSRPLQFYKMGYNFHWYQPIWKDFILSTLGAFGYGGGFGHTNNLPFFHNYFAGGIGVPGAVRGFGTNTLGPLDSNARPIGGNMLVAGSVGIIFPNFVSPERLRTTIFLDAGNVYNTHLAPEPRYYPNQHAGPIRLSAGLGIEWRIPMFEGIFSFSIAKPLNARSGRPGQPGLGPIPGDDKQTFQFTFGTLF